jgi:hypothetical protein
VPRLHHPHPRRGSLLKHATALKDQIQTKTEQILLEYRIVQSINTSTNSAEKILQGVCKNNSTNYMTSQSLRNFINQNISSLPQPLSSAQQQALDLMTHPDIKHRTRFYRAHGIHHLSMFLENKPPTLLASHMQSLVGEMLDAYSLRPILPPATLIVLFVADTLYDPKLINTVHNGQIQWDNLSNDLLQYNHAKHFLTQHTHPLASTIRIIYLAIALNVTLSKHSPRAALL